MGQEIPAKYESGMEIGSKRGATAPISLPYSEKGVKWANE
jgi:hypothetical protein